MLCFSKSIQSSALALLTGLVLAATPLSSADASDLQKSLKVTDAVIKLSDIFTDTGKHGETVIMEAPAPGNKMQLSSYELVRLAAKYDLEWDRPAYLKRVYLHREGTPFTLEDVKVLIAEQAQENGLPSNIAIKIFGRKNGLFLPSDYSVQDIELGSFDLNSRQDRFTAKLLIPTGTNEPTEIRITGTIDEVRLVPMFNRVITPGEVITKADISWVEYPAKRINRNALLSGSQILGYTVRRALSPGKPLLQNDLRKPVAVKKGSILQMTYKAGNLTLSVQGRALEDGGIGETIRIMNPVSKKTIFAEIINSGQARIAVTAPIVLAAR
ncbi:MAG: flagellar basal body P-ring formation protein FlgA [Kordiimonadaceae bacterium]|nr:flagellar basal body P-ring formation protein FlgA [Kordiimonadaceae bacterium]MBL4789852.1 flagellar basal body P-ring formation protein FlgA [Kordiimonadaceae bacterium]